MHIAKTCISKKEIMFQRSNRNIGNNDGMYLAHLHFEIRDKLNLPIGPGYSDDFRDISTQRYL